MSTRGFPPVVKKLPLTSSGATDLVPLFLEELRLCKVHQGETILLFTDSQFNPHYPAAFAAAAQVLGAEPVTMSISPHGTRLDNPTIVEAWKRADMVIGMSTVPWLYTDAHNEALDAGTRTLMVVEPDDVLRRLFPAEEVRRRTEASATVLGPGNRLRITSEAGSDMTMDKTGRQATLQYGYTDEPGRWDHWPGGLIACAPIEGSVEGTLVVDVGDIIFRLNRYVEHPIHITLREGRIVKIEGGLDAILLRDYLANWQDDKAYVVSHIGWGTEHRAVWNTLGIRYIDGGGIMDAETYMGNMQIAFGSNFMRMLGGKNKTAAHIDIPCRKHSFYVDERLVVDRGTIVAEEIISAAPVPA